jgi:serine protease Do
MGRFERNVWKFAGAGLLAGVLLTGAMVWADEERGETIFEFHPDHPRAFLGVQLDGARSGGAHVDRVIEGSAAERAGLRAGDVIVGLDGSAIDNPGDLTRRLRKTEPGDLVDLEVERDGGTETLSAELGEWQGLIGLFEGDLEEQMERLHEQLEDLDLDMKFNFDFRQLDFSHDGGCRRSSRPKLGVELVGVTPELREHLGAAGDEGVLVGRVLVGMPAEEAGVQVGDLIVTVNGDPIDGPHALRQALRDKSGETIDLDVIRDGSRIGLSVFIPRDEEQDAGFERDRPARPASAVGATRRT